MSTHNDKDIFLPAIDCEFCGAETDRLTQECPGCSVLCPCEARRVPLANVPASEHMIPECDECAAEISKERIVEALIAASPESAPISSLEAMAMAVEAILGGRTLLNGGGAHPDDEDPEPETVEQAAPESLADLMADPTCGRRGAAA